jgi:hypothetical protein
VALGAASGFVLARLLARRDDNPVRMRARV